jgi:hypothetical protein
VFTTDHASFFSANTADLSDTGNGILPVFVAGIAGVVVGGLAFSFYKVRRNKRP